MLTIDFTEEVSPPNDTRLWREGSSIILTLGFDTEMDAREYLGTLLMYLEQGSVSLIFKDGGHGDENSMVVTPPAHKPAKPLDFENPDA